MNNRACRTGSGAPSFCWQCQNQLRRAPGKGLGLFYFHLVTSPGGVTQRVHGDCLPAALLDGCKFVQPVPARPLATLVNAEQNIAALQEQIALYAVARMKRVKRERDIERYLVKRAKELGGEVRKVAWPGRRFAPDRLVMMPPGIVIYPGPEFGYTIWIELKAPGEKPTSGQLREHERMRALGQRVVVIDSIEGVDEVLK